MHYLTATVKNKKSGVVKQIDIESPGVWGDDIKRLYRVMNDWLEANEDWQLVGSHLSSLP